jgi:putative membrane protein
MLTATIKKNDAKARWLIGIFSVIVFAAVSVLGKVKLNINLGFNTHVFAEANAIINSMVTALLIAGVNAARQGRYIMHKRIMYIAMILSVLFLLSYICHHLFTGETLYGDINHDGMVSIDEKQEAGFLRTVYLIILSTHIPLAGLVLPFVLFTAYRALTGEWEAHKKLAKIVWPVWLYVSITGVLVYLLISPYYS